MATTLTINAKVGTNDETSDTVAHYDAAGKLVVENMYTASYHEYGTVAFADIQKGRVVAETGGHIEVAIVTAEATVAFAQENGGTIGTAYAISEANKNTNNTDSTKKELTYLESVTTVAAAENKADDYKQDSISEELSQNENYVARIGFVGYTTLDAAAADYKSGDIIYVLKDIEIDTQCSIISTSVNVDFGNHKFHTSFIATNGLAAYLESALLLDGAKTGTISNANIVSDNGIGIYAADGYSLTLNNCVVENKNIADNASSTSKKNTPYDSAVRVTEGSTVTIESGSYTGYYAVRSCTSGGTININGGTFNGYLSAAASESGAVSTINITGGTFNGKAFSAMTQADWQALCIDGGTITGVGTDKVIISKSVN